MTVRVGHGHVRAQLTTLLPNGSPQNVQGNFKGQVTNKVRTWRSRKASSKALPTPPQLVSCSFPNLVRAFLSTLARLSYDRPPLDDVTLEEFEICAINRLRILAEIESSFVRNRSWEDLRTVTNAQCNKYMPLNANTAKNVDTVSQRWADHLGHFVLRLAFCRS